MKKFIISSIILLLLAGCSASVSASNAAWHKQSVSSKNVVENKKPTDVLKLERNRRLMTKLVKYLGTREHKTPYVFSGSTSRGWDCSGMVVWLYERFGITLPHSADKQAHVGKRVSLDDVRVGDIAVYAYNGSTNFYHSSIVYKIKTTKDGKKKIWIVHANRSTGTTNIEPISIFKKCQIRFVRVVEQRDKNTSSLF